MKSLEVQFRQTLEVYRTTKKEEKSKMPAILLPQYEGVIGSLLKGLPIVRNAEGKVAASLCFAEAAKRKAEGDRTVDYGVLGSLLRVLDTWTRSDLGHASKNGVAVFNVLVPLPLYYKKKQLGIQYEEWDKQDPSFPLLVGKGLNPILSLKEEQVDFINEFQSDTEYLLAQRAEVLSKARNSYAVSPVLQIKDGRTLRVTPPLQHIVYQTWNASPELRIEDAMILDLFNWDNVPKPFPIVNTSTKQLVEKVAKELGTKETDFSNFGIPF